MPYTRVLAFAGALAFVAAGGVAEDTPLASGARVRVKISTQRTKLIGKLLAFDDRNLSLQVEDELEVRILPRERVTDLAVSKGRRSWGRRLLYGAGAGALTATAITYATTDKDDDAIFTQNEVAGIYAFYGGVIGGLVGLVAIPGERWRGVPLDDVRLSVGPVPGRGVGVFVSIGF